MTRTDPGRGPGGGPALPPLRVLTSYSRVAYGWDGTPEGAQEIIDGAAESRAEMVSYDYWVTDGWRTQTQYGPE